MMLIVLRREDHGAFRRISVKFFLSLGDNEIRPMAWLYRNFKPHSRGPLTTCVPGSSLAP